MPVHPWGITGRDTSTMASSWAWAHGPDGVMATAGEAIASSAMEVAGITAEPAASLPVEAPAAGRHPTPPRSVRMLYLPTLVERSPAQLVPQPGPRLHMSRQRTSRQRTRRLREAAVAQPTALVQLRLAAPRMAATPTSNLPMQHQAAELTRSAALHLAPPGLQYLRFPRCKLSRIEQYPIFNPMDDGQNLLASSCPMGRLC